MTANKTLVVLVSEEYLKTRKTAFALLSKREHSVQELRNKLLAKGLERRLVYQVSDEMVQDDYLSDVRYAEMMFRHRFSRGNGPKRILYDLHQKGVPDDLIQQALQAFDGDWHQLAQDVRRKRFGVWSDGTYGEKTRQMRFLLARGFESDHIETAFDC